MKTVILAGGFGTRLAEETEIRPKPMVEIGGKPILWHIMSIYAHWGFSDFTVALGYKGEVIKDFFLDYHSRSRDLTVELSSGAVDFHSSDEDSAPEWKVSLVDTGASTMTGGRIRRLASHLDGSTFMATYGDGVADVNVLSLVDFHRAHGRLATVTAVRPPARFGGLVFDGDRVKTFAEKPQSGEGWINGGFFVLEPEVIDYIDGDDTIWERGPLERLAADGQLMAYKHEGFWQPMDTLREKQILAQMWESGTAPWKVW